MSQGYRKDIDKEAYNLERVADLLFEFGMLKKTPRSGFAFLGSGKESVAEHSWRTSAIGFVLARLANADPARVVFLCLFHDLHEARTGDFNYVNHRYNDSRARDALIDGLKDSGFEKELLEYWDQLERRSDKDAILAHDADQLDLILNLREEEAKGNAFASEWLVSALKRLASPEARALADVILKTDPNNWWYGRVEKDWWVNHGK